MKQYEEVQIIETKEMLKSITCNKCGKHEKLNGDEVNRGFQMNSYQSFKCSFAWEFDICGKCLIDFIRTFKYLPENYDEVYADRIYKIHNE